MSTQLPAAHEEVPPPTIEEVSPGIYAYIQLDGSWFLNNAGCIVGSRSATVIDTTGTEKRARAFHAAVRQVTQLPVSALINTHSHGDHTHGNFMFAPASAIIASERCRQEIIAAGHAAYALFPMVDFGDCPVTPPTVTFDERLNVYVDDLRVELLFMGPAHTTNDIVAWIPERKLLFSGDLVFNRGTPFALGGSVGGGSMRWTGWKRWGRRRSCRATGRWRGRRCWRRCGGISNGSCGSGATGSIGAFRRWSWRGSSTSGNSRSGTTGSGSCRTCTGCTASCAASRAGRRSISGRCSRRCWPSTAGSRCAAWPEVQPSASRTFSRRSSGR
ncbi:MBL fold metallo-hydrolase [Tepidiforma flava]|uniref:MBL fold metallo-hydrolase n=1 Tax=Tepidiforma flava TaxID=3004094 RepID=A0ABY7M820_9CHLR|nr:MBL fold metallo-hydrolase [Tepidiforma flava]WBL36437.1 MBL fold metallo-hydrolase [Tepidiforma flava]